MSKRAELGRSKSLFGFGRRKIIGIRHQLLLKDSARLPETLARDDFKATQFLF